MYIEILCLSLQQAVYWISFERIMYNVIIIFKNVNKANSLHFNKTVFVCKKTTFFTSSYLASIELWDFNFFDIFQSADDLTTVSYCSEFNRSFRDNYSILLNLNYKRKVFKGVKSGPYRENQRQFILYTNVWQNGK